MARAAADLLAERGYRSVSVVDAADVSGLSLEEQRRGLARPSPQHDITGSALTGDLQLGIEELGARRQRGEDLAATVRRLWAEVDRQLNALAALG